MIFRELVVYGWQRNWPPLKQLSFTSAVGLSKLSHGWHFSILDILILYVSVLFMTYLSPFLQSLILAKVFTTSSPKILSADFDFAIVFVLSLLFSLSIRVIAILRTLSSSLIWGKEPDFWTTQDFPKHFPGIDLLSILVLWVLICMVHLTICPYRARTCFRVNPHSIDFNCAVIDGLPLLFSLWVRAVLPTPCSSLIWLAKITVFHGSFSVLFLWFWILALSCFHLARNKLRSWMICDACSVCSLMLILLDL